MHSYPPSSPLRSRGRHASDVWLRVSGRVLSVLLEIPPCPSTFSQAIAISRWAIPPPNLSPMKGLSRSLVLARCAPLRAIRCLPPAAWRHCGPQDACSRLERPILIAMAVALCGSMPFVATPPQPLRLCLLSGLLEPPLRGQLPEGTQ